MTVFNENGATVVPSATAEFAFMENGEPSLKNCTPAQAGEAIESTRRVVTATPSTLKASIEYAAANGYKVVCPNGIYPITEKIQVSVPTDFEIVCDTGAVFVVDAAFPVDTQVFVFIGTAGVNHRFRWSGGVIDGRLQPAKVGVAAPDLLSISGDTFNEVIVENVEFLQNSDRTGTAGDSCLFLTEGQSYTVRNCKFQGAVDAAIYVSGNAAQTKGSKVNITGNTFYRCNVGYIAKRSFEDQIIGENFFIECTYGAVVGGEADSTLLPGKKAIINANIFKKCLVPVTVRIADGTIVTNNRFEDFAVNSSLSPTTARAVSIEGSDYCIVKDNYFSMPNYTPAANTEGVRIASFVYNSITYTSDYNDIDGNMFIGLPRGVHEDAGSYNVIGPVNQFVSCTVPTRVVGTGSFVGARIQGVAPELSLFVADQGTDEKRWRFNATGKQLSITARNDDGTIGSTVLSVFRTGGMINSYIMQLQGFPDYADDVAAAAGGVPVSGMYRTGSAIKIRVS